MSKPYCQNNASKTIPSSSKSWARTATILRQEREAVDKALNIDGVAGLVLPATNDRRTIKAAFIKEHTPMLTEQGNQGVVNQNGEAHIMLKNADKYKESVTAWMFSTLRAVLASGKGKGFQGIPASLILTSCKIGSTTVPKLPFTIGESCMWLYCRVPG